MKQTPTKIKYFAYLRKSSDSEDRQVQSIEDQKREMLEYALKNNLEIIEYLEESCSAFTVGRPVFNNIVKRIKKGEANGILVWHANRVSRNPVDSGIIISLIDSGELAHVRTPSHIYGNTPTEKMMLSLEFMLSKKDSDDKSEAVKRGFEGKAIKGYPSGVAPIGFTNDRTEEKGNRKWIIDPDRFEKVKTILHLFLDGKHSAPKLHRMAMKEMKLTTPIRKREGGKPVAESYLYTMLGNPIYAGFFFYDDERYELHSSLPRMITEDEYWQIQTMLGQKGRPRERSNGREGIYNYIMKDQNGGPTTPDFKFQVICECKYKFSYVSKDICPKCGFALSESSKLTYLEYVYYYSSRDKKAKVKGLKGIEERKIDKYIINNLVNEVQLSPELSQWCIDNISEAQDPETKQNEIILKSKDEAINQIKRKLSNLLDLRINKGVLSDEDARMFDEKELLLKSELKDLEGSEKREDASWFPKAKKKFSLMAEIAKIIDGGSRLAKREALIDFGSNLTLNNGKLNIINVKEVQLFIDCLKKAKTINEEFEPKYSLANKRKTEAFTSVVPTLLRG